MEVIVQRGCGLDVHQKSITGCIMRQGYARQVKTFATHTAALLDLKAWLTAERITDVAIESTGVYWKPVYNILGQDFNLVLVNARHIKNVPGRKTDVMDAEWLCKLLRAGLLSGSFIPSLPVRRLRDLTRYRKKLLGGLQSEKNRIHKLLQDANIKLTCVLTDIFGKTGRKVLNDLAGGLDAPTQLSQYFAEHGLLKHSPQEAELALTGFFDEHHRRVLSTMLARIDFLDDQMSELQHASQELIGLHFSTAYNLLQTIPGVKQHAAGSIIAEIGTDMSHFASAAHLASWAGLCPGQRESAGVKASGRIRKGNKYFKTMLVECAWCAVRTKETYLRAKYYRLIPRMGKRKAMVAIAHKLAIACYHILNDEVPYRELGPDYLDERKQAKMIAYHTKQLEKLSAQSEGA